jgi:membrane fusion protein, multidrug efflux system
VIAIGMLRPFYFLAVFAAISPLSVSLAAETAASKTTVRAQLTPRQVTVLASEIGAKVSRLGAQEGQGFKLGDVLVSFEDSLQRAQVERANAVLTAAEKALGSNRRLLALNSIGQIELDASEAEVGKARAELSYAQAMLAKCTVKAPFSGRVAEQRVHEQEFVQAGQPLLEIIDDAVPQLDCIVPSKWLAWLHVGQKARVHIDETGRDYPVVVERVGAKVDPISQSVKVVSTVQAEPSELIAGMSGTLEISPE